jgi:hypothetical protein
MAYQVNRFNGTFLVSVTDGTIDSSTNLRFVGKNYAGYGQVQNENFLYLLENFSGSNQPSKPLSGQLWFDTVSKKINVYDGAKFKLVGGANSTSTAPLGLSPGEFWFDNVAQQLYTWTGSQYVLIGPVNPATLGETSLTSQVVKDSTGTNQTIAKIQSGGTVIAVISKTTFLLNSSLNPIPGFTSIKKGVTLVDTDDNGVTGISSGSTFWGTASSAYKIGEEGTSNYYTINDLVKTNNPSFSAAVSFSDNGLTIGRQNNLSVALDGTSNVVFQNQTGSDIKFNIRVSDTDVRTILDIGPTSITPGTSSAFDLGSSTNRWGDFYAVDSYSTFHGNLYGNVTGNTVGSHTGPVIGSVTGNLTGNVTGELFGNATTATSARKLNESQADVAATPSTIVLRDASANIIANRFTGTADKVDRLRIDNSQTDTDVFYRSAKTTKTANTIAARDSAANLSANIFNGTATAVQNADLAEKYLADDSYPVGTVIAVGGENEVTAAWPGSRAIGVVSGAPGLMMNQDLEDGTYIALKGRVPVFVTGPISKGDSIMAGDDGTATSTTSLYDNTVLAFGVALETNLDEGVKLVECIIL